MDTKIVISKLYKFRKKWKIRKAHRAVALMNKVINSDEFRQKVFDYPFTDRRFRYSLEDEWEEVTDNKRIYEILKKGNEQYTDRVDDYKWKLKLKLGKWLYQVGRRERDLIITQNWFIKSSTDNQLAAHWFHEHAHVLGFHHDYEPTDIRPDSIPYGLGTIVKEVLKELEN